MGVVMRGIVNVLKMFSNFSIHTASIRRTETDSDQLILPGICESASFRRGRTTQKTGTVWNTMPPQIHSRRSEVYLYFDLSADDRVFHYMGR